MLRTGDYSALGYCLSLIIPISITWGVTQNVIPLFPALFYIVTAVQSAFGIIWMRYAVLHRRVRKGEATAVIAGCYLISFSALVWVMSAALPD